MSALSGISARGDVNLIPREAAKSERLFQRTTSPQLMDTGGNHADGNLQNTGEAPSASIMITGAPVEPWQTTADKRHLLSQIDTACSSFFSMDVHFQASDVLGEICFLMLVQKSKELKEQENDQKSAAWQPFLHLVSHLHTRRERGISVQAELEGPGGIQSRGYFLYRPRNGRRALEYE